MKRPFTRIACLSLAAVLGFAVAQAQPVTITPMTSFGGDGNLTVAEADAIAATHGLSAGSILNTVDRARGMAYNRATGNLIVVSRGTVLAPGNFVNVLDGTTGGFVRRLSIAGIAGGTFLVNMAGVSDDGQVFVGNLQIATGGNFSLYRWANDSVTGASTRVFHGATPTNNPRLGDSLDVMGSGNSVRVVAGSGTHGANVGRGYLLLDQTGADTFAHTYTDFGTTVSSDFRLGITFSHDGTRVLGTQGMFGTVDRRMHVTDPGVPAHLGTVALNWNLERFLDARFINGFHMLATADSDMSRVRIYNIDDALNPVFRADIHLFPGGAAANVNATGSIQWGAVNGKDATLYVMNTNHGIQAYNVEVIPEPATLITLGAGLAALLARRRRKK